MRASWLRRSRRNHYCGAGESHASVFGENLLTGSGNRSRRRRCARRFGGVWRCRWQTRQAGRSNPDRLRGPHRGNHTFRQGRKGFGNQHQWQGMRPQFQLHGFSLRSPGLRGRAVCPRVQTRDVRLWPGEQSLRPKDLEQLCAYLTTLRAWRFASGGQTGRIGVERSSD